MVIHICRDYLTQNTTTANRPWIPSYLASIFLRRVLGYTYVGDTNFPVNGTGTLLIVTGDTTPTASSPTYPVGNRVGVLMNGATIEVSIPPSVKGVSNAADNGRILCLKSSLYPTRNSGLFVITGVNQGNTTTVAAASNGQALPGTGNVISVASVTGFPTSGTLFIGAITTVASGSNNISLLNTTVAVGSNGVSLPTGTINAANVTGFPTSGTITVVTSNGPQLVTYTNTNTGTNQFTGCSGGTGSMTTGNNIFSPGTLNVVSTTGFATSGTLLVGTSNGPQTITYTASTSTTFTGCQSGGSGVLFTGATVTTSNGIQTVTYSGTNTGTNQFTGTSGGTGNLVTSEPVSNKNNYTIDYRANGDVAMTEAADTVGWYLYDKDINCPISGANNTAGAGEYRGSGNSTTPRIILQSPHATGWQIRICDEAPQDYSTNFNVNLVTFCPGFGGNASGDFAIGGKHLHGAQFWDSSIFGYNTCTGLGDNAGTGPQHRITMWGGDDGYTFHSFGRRPGDATTPEGFYVTFGLPENEPSPLPLDNTERLYALGNGAYNNQGNQRMNQGALSTGSYVNTNRIQGASFHLVPISCSPSLWTYLNPVNQQASPIYDASAGDSPFTSATELTSVDLVVGTVHTWVDGSDNNTVRLPYYPRVIGNLPLVRAGRTNFGEYTLTTDNGSWSVSTTSGNGVSPIQITTTTTNTLVTGQTVAVNGVTGNTAANGTFIITVLNNTQFTLNGTTGNGNFISGGTVYRGASYQHMRFGTYFPWTGPAVVP